MQIANAVINYVAEIAELVGRLISANKLSSNLMLRRVNRIRIIRVSFAIEQNMLNLEQLNTFLNISFATLNQILTRLVADGKLVKYHDEKMIIGSMNCINAEYQIKGATNMRIKQAVFTKLFGFFNYTLDLHDTVTIIHGPNGCGKTTMLKIINAVFNKQLSTLKATDFESVKFSLSDGSYLTIFRKQYSSHVPKRHTSNFYYIAYMVEESGEAPLIFDPFEKSDEYFTVVDKYLHSPRPLPFLERTGAETWFDRRLGKEYSLEEAVEKYGVSIYRRYSSNEIEDIIPEKVQAIIDSIDVRLISADRLTVQKRVERQYGEDSLEIKQKVDVIAQDISDRIKNTIQKYAQLSQAKDRTFPLRAIKNNSPMSVQQIKDKMVELESKRKEFVETGILEESQDIDIRELVDAVTEANRQNLSLYAADTEEKLAALSDLSASINLFRRLIDSSFNHKQIVFDKDKGFYFVTTYSGSVVNPKSLSSGEQHELVMFYDLIFNTTPSTLVLIDEPELSLHIKWQIDYVDRLLEIIKITGFYTLLATHSPQIIHDKWDYTISLTETN